MSDPTLTDRRAIRLALSIAIDEEMAAIDAYSGVSDGSGDEARKQATKNIAAFRRVLERHFGDGQSSLERMLVGTKSVSLAKCMRLAKGTPPHE